MGYVAPLDGNVLHQWVLCDLLLRQAERGLFRPVWSKETLDELVRSIRSRRPDPDDDQLRRRVEQMELAFPEAMVEGTDAHRAAVPAAVDPGGVHVVAAAIAGRADAIVTHNLRHIPPDAVGTLGIVVPTRPGERPKRRWDEGVRSDRGRGSGRRPSRGQSARVREARPATARSGCSVERESRSSIARTRADRRRSAHPVHKSGHGHLVPKSRP